MRHKLSRRQILDIAAGIATLSACSRTVWALDYPTRSIRMIVGFPAGSVADVLARPMAQWLSQRLGEQVIVDDRPGASSNIATEAVVRASPDGYTLLLVTLPNAVNASLYKSLSFDFIRDIAPVAGIARSTGVMVVPPSFPAKTVPEFIAYAKSNPGKINMATAGAGSFPFCAGELFKSMAGIDLVQVPYRGSYVPDLLAGRVQVCFPPLPVVIAQIRAGKLVALGVTGATRSKALPGAPAIGEFVSGYEATVWDGVGAPRNTSTAIIDKLNSAVNAALADPANQAKLADLGSVPMSMTPAEFHKFIVDETARWAKVLKLAHVKPM
jgi:tripartite-type tricarboxylate transporter receptor subunit TctC